MKLYHLECPVCEHSIECNLNEELECPECGSILYQEFEVTEENDFEEIPKLFLKE